MELLKKEEINSKRKLNNQMLAKQAEKCISTIRKATKIAKDLDIDQEKMKKYREYEVWCEDLNKKKNEQLKELKKYQDATELVKQEFFHIIARRDELINQNLDLKEENSQLELQVKWNKLALTNA